MLCAGSKTWRIFLVPRRGEAAGTRCGRAEGRPKESPLAMRGGEERRSPPVLPADLITLKTAAKILNVHRGTVYRWVLEGRLRAYRIAGCRYMVSRPDLEAAVRPVGVVPDHDPAAERAREALRRGGFA